MPTTTRTRYYDCPECGAHLLVLRTMHYTMLDHMLQAGEITVGEMRDEISDPITQALLGPEDLSLLAGWVLHRADQGDDWRAGDPEVLPCGCRVAYYDPEQVERCGSPVCTYRDLEVVR